MIDLEALEKLSVPKSIFGLVDSIRVHDARWAWMMSVFSSVKHPEEAPFSAIFGIRIVSSAFIPISRGWLIDARGVPLGFIDFSTGQTIIFPEWATVRGADVVA